MWTWPETTIQVSKLLLLARCLLPSIIGPVTKLFCVLLSYQYRTV